MVGLEAEWTPLVHLLGPCAHARLLSICPHTAGNPGASSKFCLCVARATSQAGTRDGVLGVSVHVTLLQPALPSDCLVQGYASPAPLQ